MNINVIERVTTTTDLASLFDDNPPRAEIPQHIKQDDNRPLFDFTLGHNDGIRLPSGASTGYRFELFLKELTGTGASLSSIEFDICRYLTGQSPLISNPERCRSAIHRTVDRAEREALAAGTDF
jgi:hypothetical protein